MTDRAHEVSVLLATAEDADDERRLEVLEDIHAGLEADLAGPGDALAPEDAARP